MELPLSQALTYFSSYSNCCTFYQYLSPHIHCLLSLFFLLFIVPNFIITLQCYFRCSAKFSSLFISSTFVMNLRLLAAQCDQTSRNSQPLCAILISTPSIVNWLRFFITHLKFSWLVFLLQNFLSNLLSKLFLINQITRFLVTGFH